MAMICARFMALCLVVSCVAATNSVWRRELATRSWDSVGFHEDVSRSPLEDQIIIGVLDSGIWPESLSFSDVGLGPPPAKWKGVCQTGNSSIPFKCNNKIIGARFYVPDTLYEGDDLSPRDTIEHGTHVAATIAGVPVRNVSFKGVGLGTARGAVPKARIAVYKICWAKYCVDTWKGVLDAVNDGVDMISMSVGMVSAVPYESDHEAYATFQAMKAGIFISMLAGNNGTLEQYTVSNIFPWAVTVSNSAGSGTDYISYVTTGDGKRLEGAFLNTIDSGMKPLVRVEEVTNATDFPCNTANIIPGSVDGKLIMCTSLPYSLSDVKCETIGCAGFIIDSSTFERRYISARDNFGGGPVAAAPVTILRGDDFKQLLEYYEKSKSAGQPATASIGKSVPAPDTPPRIVTANGRGPNIVDINILKPDVSAPGSNELDAAHGEYVFKSGTSMATPFLTGVAAYIKSQHPTWSAAAIKSALMTTATPMTDPHANQGPLVYGSGQISPPQANDPGLVYDISELDYVKYLCQFANFSNEWVQKFTKNTSYNCAELKIEKGWTLNYPSFAVPVTPNQPFTSVFRRTLTNVANSSVSNYKVIVNAPKEVTITVEPSVLAFTKEGEALSYTLTVSGQLPKSSEEFAQVYGWIVWTDGSHQVKSAISVYEKLVDFDAQFTKSHGFTRELYDKYFNTSG